MRTIRDEKIPIDRHAGGAQCLNFLEKRQRIKHHTIADNAAAPGAQHAAGYELKNKFLAVDDDRMAGVVSPGIADNHLKAFRQYVNDLSLALIAPLGANDNRGCTFFQFQLHQGNSS